MQRDISELQKLFFSPMSFRLSGQCSAQDTDVPPHLLHRNLPQSASPHSQSPGLAPDIASRLQIRFQNMEEDLRRLTGQVEEMAIKTA